MPFTYIIYTSAAASVCISAQEVVELVYTTVAKEWPPSAYLLATLHVDIHNLDARLRTRFGKDLALRPCNETVAPELYAARSAARVILVAAAVYRHYGKAVCDGMAALHRTPRIQLPALLLHRIAALPAYGRRVYQYLGTVQRQDRKSVV